MIAPSKADRTGSFENSVPLGVQQPCVNSMMIGYAKIRQQRIAIPPVGVLWRLLAGDRKISAHLSYPIATNAL